MLTGKFLADDIGIAAVTEKSLPKPVIETIKRRLALWLYEGNDAASAQISSNRVACAAKFLGQSLRAPAKPM